MTESDWFPTRAGKFSGYEAEFLDGEQWRRVPSVKVPDFYGSPYPQYCGGILQEIGLLGFEQANAIAWGYAAACAAHGTKVEVRVQCYEVRYDLKARKINDEDMESKP